MTPAVRTFIDFLVSEMEETESTAFVDGLLSAAKTQIENKGELSFMTQGGENGKVYQRAQNLSPVEIAYACRQALRIYGTGSGGTGITFIDFSAL